MSTKTHDQEIIAILAEKVGITPNAVEYNDQGNLTKLSLSKLGLFQLSSEIWQLTNLQTIDLSSTRLGQVPPEIGQLTDLQTLNLNNIYSLLKKYFVELCGTEKRHMLLSSGADSHHFCQR